MPKINPYDPLYIPNPADLRKPEVSPKGEGLRKTAEANRQVVEAMHQGDQDKAWYLSRAYGGALEGAAEITGKIYKNYRQAAQQLNTHLANAAANKIVDDQQYNLARYSDYVQSRHMNDPVAALNEYTAGVQNGITVPMGSEPAIVVKNHEQLNSQLLSYPQDPTPKITAATGMNQIQQNTSESAIHFHNWYTTTAANKVVTDAQAADDRDLQTFSLPPQQAGGIQ